MFNSKTFFCGVFAFAISACSTKSTTPIYEPFRHSVKYEGENIGIISEWYTGDSANYSAIIKENQNINPDRIELGDSIIIPKNLLINKSPLTEEYVRAKSQPILPPAVTGADLVKEDNGPLVQKDNNAPVPTKLNKKDTEELIKTREDLWQELIGE